MADIYHEFQDIASSLFAEFKQGTVRLVEPGAKTGSVGEPTYGADTFHSVNATVTGVPEKYIDGTTIRTTDLMVSFAGNAVTTRPDTTWRIEIDDKEHEIIQDLSKPPVGVVAVYRFAVRA